MARQALPILGAAIGFVVSGFNPMGAQIGFAAGSIVGNIVDPLVVQGPKIGENAIQAALEGGPRSIVIGKGPVSSTCVLARGNRQIKKHRERASKGGGPVTVTERVYWTFAIGLGEPSAALLRAWEDEKLVYDVTPGSTILAESAKYAERFRFYTGAEDQLPDPDLEVIFGIGNTPYHRGTAYVVFPNYDLTDRRESLPNFRFEVATEVSSNPAAMLAFRSLANRNGYAMQISSDWLGSWVRHFELDASCRYAVPFGSRVLTYTSGGTPAYTDDFGSSYSTSANQINSSGGTRWSWPDGSTILFAGGVADMQVSSDGGQSISNVSGSPDSSAVVKFSGKWLSAYSGQIKESSGPSGPWSDVASVSLIGISSRWTNGSLCMFGGQKVSAPGLFSTSDGVIFNEESLPVFATATRVTCLHDHEGIWVAGTDSGEIAYRDSMGAWHLSASTLGGAANEVTHNGQEFVMIGNSSSNGYIKSSSNGNTWQLRMTDSIAFGELWTSVVSLNAPPDVVGEPVPLSAIVSKLHGYAKQDVSKFDVSELTDMVAGVVFAGSYSVADAIRSVISPYFADAADYDKKIRYVKRGKPVVRTLSYDDLVDEPEESKRENAAEYPRKVNMMYASPSVGYAPAKATSSRSSPEVKVVGEVEVQIPVVIESPDEAAQIVDKMHKTIWAEAEGDIDLHVTDEHLDLVATDCVGVALRGIVRRVRLVRSEDDPGQRKFKLRSDRQSAVTSNVTGIPLPPVTPPRPSIISETALGILDVSGLWDGDDDLNYYAAMSGMSETWAGSVLQRSLDDGATFGSANSTDLNAIMGVLQDGISDASEHYTDTTNVVRVQLYMQDDIDSLTDQQFLSEQGAFAVRRPDSSWEVMQYRDADDLGDGLYELTTLHRGRLNSGTSAHLPGAIFVLLDSAVVKVPAGSGWIGADLTHRAVSNGLSPETADEQTQEYVGSSQIEWPVAHVALARASNTINVTIVPRHRFGTDDAPVRSSNWAGYRVTATDGTSIFTADQIGDTAAIDVTGWSSPVTVTVAQLNRITLPALGPGPTVSESIA